MEEQENPFTGLPISANSTDPITDAKNINPFTGQEINPDNIISTSGSTLTPKIHEQIRLLNNDASYLRTNPNPELAIAQGRGEEVSRAFKGFGKNLLGGFIDAVGVDFDPTLGLNVVGGVDEHYDKAATNVFTRLAESLRDTEGNEIYLKNPDSFNPGDSAWWSEMFQQSGTSVGIMIEALAETALVSYATAGLASEIEIPLALRKLQLIPKLTKAQQLKKNALIWAGLRRYSESVIEAKDNGLQVYKDFRRRGKTDQEASKAASETSQRTFIGNAPLLAFDLITAGVLTNYNPVSGSSNLKQLFTTGNKLLDKGIGLGVGALSEGSEEFWQELVNQESIYKVNEKNGLIEANDSRFNDYFKSGKAWNAFASGIFGSAVLGGISKGLDKISTSSYQKNIDKNYNQFIDNITGTGIELTKQINSLEKQGDIGKANILRRNLGVNKALTAVHLDNLTNNNNALDSYKEYLNSVLTAANSNNEAELEALGISDVDHIKNNFPKYIEDATKIEAIYNREKQYNDPDFLPLVVSNEFSLDILSERKGQLQSVITDPSSVLGDRYSNLSTEAKEWYDLSVQKEFLEGEELSQANARIRELGPQLSAEDKTAISTIAVDPLSNAYSELNQVNNAIGDLSSKLSLLKDKSLQRKSKESKFNNTVNNSTSSTELRDIKDNSPEELSKETTELINSKIEENEVKESVIEPEGDSFTEEDLNEVSPERKTLTETIDDSFVIEELDEELFEPLEVKELNQEQKDTLKSTVRDYYDSLKIDLKKNPSFEDFVKDYIEHSDKDNVDKLFNVLVEGWKQNRYPTSNFEEVYNKIFRDRKEIGKFLTNIGNSLVTDTIDNKQQLEQTNTQELKQSVSNVSPIISIKENSVPIRHSDPFKASDSKLRAAHLSVPYSSTKIVGEDGNVQLINQDTTDSLNNSQNVNSIKLLDPDRYNAGERLSIRIPDNYRDIQVQSWIDESTKGPVVSFAQWLQDNNVEIGSDEFYSKVPVIAYDSDGDGVFYVHDTEWYNFVNVGLSDDPQKQNDVIIEARKHVLDLRKQLVNNPSLQIEITEKRAGTWKTIPKDQEPISLNEADPDTQLAISDSTGNLYVDGKELFETNGKELINKKQFVPGHTYEIRKVTDKQSIALNVLRPKLNESSVETLKQAIRTYVLQYTSGLNNIDYDKYSGIRNSVINETGLDLFDRKDFEDFLNLYVHTIKRSFDTQQDIVKYVSSRDDIATGSPFLVLQKGSLVFGIKNSNIIPNKDFLYLNPNLLKGEDPQKIIKNFGGITKELDKIIPQLSQNISKQGLTNDISLVNISSDGSVIPGKKYKNYLKDNLKTNVRSYNIGTEESPKYATIVQPVINFKLVEDNSEKVWYDFVNTGEVPQEKVEEIKDKIKSGETLDERELSISSQYNDEIENSLKEDQNEEQVLRDTLESLRELGVSEDDESIKTLKRELGIDNELFEPEIISQKIVDRIKTDNPLSIIQEFNLVDYVFNNISTKIGFNLGEGFNKKQILDEIRNSYFDFIEPKKTNSEKTLVNLKKLYERDKTANAKFKPIIEKFENELKVFDVIKNNWNLIEEKAIEKLQKYTAITEITDTDQDFLEFENEDILVEKNYSKTSLEENGKQTASYRLKRFFAGIESVKANGERKTGFLGVPVYVGFDTVYSSVEQILSSPYEMESDFDSMITRLEEHKDNQKWIPQLVEKLKGAGQRIKNEFTYNFARHTLSMKFVMFSKNRNGKTTAKVYDTNSNEINRVTKRQWESNLKNTNLVFSQDGQYKINKNKAKELLNTFNSWSDKLRNTTRKGSFDIDSNELKNWLSEFGIELSDETINELKTRKISFTTKLGNKDIVFREMFEKSANTPGLFGVLADYLENIIKKEDTEFEENVDNHPFSNANNILKTISRIESKYSLFATTNSFRDGNKSIYGFTPTKHATDTTLKLKNDQDFRDALGNKSFNGKSFLLKILNSSENFRSKFYVDHIGITAIKELGKKAFGDNSITALPDTDHEYLKVSLFQDVQQGDIEYKMGKNNSIGTRMSRMFFPTMSDKSQMLSLFTAVLNLKNKNFTISGNQVTPKDDVLDVLYSQTVEPELDRIYNYLNNVKNTDVKGYDLAAKIFLMLPEINNLVDDQQGKRIVSLINNAPLTYNKEWFNTNIKPKVYELLRQQLKDKTEKKLEDWANSGLINEDYSNNFLNAQYINVIEGNAEQKMRIAAYDYVINSQISTANVYMLYTGDLALYSQNKIKGYFENGDIFMPKSLNRKQYEQQLAENKITEQEFEELIKKDKDTVYQKITKDIIGVNLGKRLALLLAPGSKLANSKGKSYNQIFLNDHVDISSNIVKLVDIFYGKDESIKAKVIIKDYNASNNNEEKRAIADSLAEKYPVIADYFDIEATDAQEYTTVFEHIEVLWGQGRLSDEDYNSIIDSLNTGKDLNFKQLNLILQPIKPVYTGFINQDQYDLMRTVYIKTSSFPLIPQLTRGTELDKLRNLLETYEKETNKPVRASYQSGNKVGAIKNPITPFNPDGSFNSQLTTADLKNSSILLDRNNFRIQQDIPLKDKDQVSLGTQVLKLLFGDGITNIENFIYNNEKLSGQELKNKFTEIYNDYISTKKQALYDQLGVDQDGQPVSIEYTINKLQDILKEEAVNRGYPKQDIDALTLKPELDSTGKIVNLEFSVPLWMSPNSNRYEALLNAVVTNRLINIKLPGKSYVVGSEAGFKISDDISKGGNIIFTSKWQGELKAYNDKNLTQVLIPSNFRDNKGNKINLLSSKYSFRDENGLLRLKENMIDPELLDITSFRIPTSSHVSMSQVEIVGFLPPESGDLMIVPKNLTKQKGLDFDIDKEFSYKLHTRTNSEGKVEVLNENHKKEYLSYLEDNLAKQISYEQIADDLFSAIFQDNSNFIEGLYTDETLSLKEKIDKLEKEFDQKLLENEIVKIHSSVLSNKDDKVQKKINKVLSMDFAKAQSKLIEEKLEQQTDKFFTVLDDTYQKEKMYLGASGKLGIGVYSNYVVFNSMVQQIQDTLKITYTDKDLENKFSIQIGNFNSDGTLGRERSLDGDRSIAEIFAERQNTATDNEKEQIMGKVNINEITINVDSLLSSLGFDKDQLSDGREVSIPYLLLSQPIIKDYVNEIRANQSATIEFDAENRGKVVSKLIQKYAFGQDKKTTLADVLEDNDYDIDGLRKRLTGQNLYDSLSKVDNFTQSLVLNLFLDIDEYAKSVGKVQKRLNINNSGLGKSFFETIDKYYGVQDLQNVTRTNGFEIKNVNKLVGDFVEIEKSTTEQDIKALIDQGYQRFNYVLIKPNNPVGAMLVNGVKVGYDLWNKYFPYDDPSIGADIQDIVGMSSGPDITTNKKIEIQQKVFQEMKKYFVSSNKLGLFSGSPQAERQRLFIDTDTKKSLSSYLSEIANDFDTLRSNKLISRFEYSINKNGLPSLIKFDNSKGENFDEDYLYNSLIELMDVNIKLPDFNGQPYTTRKLAQDLIVYSYLEGGQQEAIQFVKYIPIKYLENIKFSERIRKWRFRPGIFEKMLGDRFLKQYFQHNPERLFKIKEDNITNPKYASTKQDLKDLIYFELDPDSLSTTDLTTLKSTEYVSIYNPFIKKGFKKFQLYKKSDTGWKRISTLGVFGMSEYSIKDAENVSIVNDTHIAEVNPTIETAPVVVEDTFNIQSNNMTEIIDNIIQYPFEEFSYLKPVAKAIKDYLPNDIKIKIAPLETKNGKKKGKGSFLNRTITIDEDHFKTSSKEAIAKTIIKESVHSLTYDYMKNFVKADGKYKVPNPPKEIVNLVILFNEVKRKLQPELDIYKGVPTTSREKNVVYGATSIYEFVEVALTEPDFQEEMKNIQYKSTSLTIFDKFVELVDSILKNILGVTYSNSGLTKQILSNIFEIIEKQAEEKGIVSPIKSMKTSDQEAQALLNDDTVDSIKPDDEIDMLLEPITENNFEDFIDRLKKKDC